MIKSVIESETLVTEVLKTIIVNGALKDITSYEQDDVFETLHRCVEDKLIEGFQTNRMASGRIVVDRRQHAFVTPKGLEFIENFSGRQTSAVAKNVLILSNKFDRISKFAIYISIISLVVAILSNLDKIYNNIIRALPYLGF